MPRIVPILTVVALSACALVPRTLVAGEADGVVRLSEPVTVTDDYEEFGAVVRSPESAVTLSELVSHADDYVGRPVTVTTQVAKVCRKKGCFFIAREGDALARITFKDYGFFIPTDSGGKEVTLNGTLERRQVTERQARHYREDLGEDPGEDPSGGPKAGTEYHIVATAVRIPRG
jgi:hypothetical protein